MAWYSNLGSKTKDALVGSKEAVQGAASRFFSKDTVRSLGKSGLIAGIVVGGTVLLGAAARAMGRSRSPEAKGEPAAAVNNFAPPEAPGPAEGYAAGQWGDYVKSGRAGQQLRGDINPRMNVGEAEDLGAIRTR